MLITDDFVLLNYPKTGSTFARKIIQEIYQDDCEELLFPVAYDSRYTGPNTQHGTYAQIPEEHRGKPVLSVIRNPFDRYVSQYHFRWYAHSPPEKKKRLQMFYPDFPDLKFAEFIDMSERFSKRNILAAYDIFSGTDIGFQSISFIAFFSGDPKKDLSDLAKGAAGPFLRLPKIHFLHQESLRDELASFLVGINRNPDIKNIISSENDLNVSRSSDERNFMQFWTPDLLAEYSEKDRFLLNAFPEYKQDIPNAVHGPSTASISTGVAVSCYPADRVPNRGIVKVARKFRAAANYVINLMWKARGFARKWLGIGIRYLKSSARHSIRK